MDPYCLLGVPRDADDQRIRRAYLEAVKAATPETDPERFKLVSAAYELIKDETHRHAHELFHDDSPGSSPLNVFLRHVRGAARPAPMPLETLKEFLRSCSKT